MPINQSPFIKLFISEFHVSPQEITSEYQRIIEEQGDTDDIKTEFIRVAFNQLIEQYKIQLPKDQNYKLMIVMLYDKYIAELEYQQLNADDEKTKRKLFMRSHPGSSKYAVNAKSSHTQYKKYNMSTKYGRRKAREQAQERYNSLTPTEKAQHNFYMFVILLVICLIMWLLLGTKGFLKWASH